MLAQDDVEHLARAAPCSIQQLGAEWDRWSRVALALVSSVSQQNEAPGRPSLYWPGIERGRLGGGTAPVARRGYWLSLLVLLGALLAVAGVLVRRHAELPQPCNAPNEEPPSEGCPRAVCAAMARQRSGIYLLRKYASVMAPAKPSVVIVHGPTSFSLRSRPAPFRGTTYTTSSMVTL